MLVMEGILRGGVIFEYDSPISSPRPAMERSFTMTRAQVHAATPEALRAKLISATESESGAESIMRSLERLGTDPTIEYYEMSEVSGRSRYGGATSGAWRVRADRGHEEGWGG